MVGCQGEAPNIRQVLELEHRELDALGLVRV